MVFSRDREKYTLNVFSLKMNDSDLLHNIEVIKRIEPGDKISVDSNERLQIDPPSFLTSFFRTYTGQNRTQSLEYVDRVITSAMLSNDREILDGMSEIMTGLLNLRKTYIQNVPIFSDLDTVLKNEARRLLNNGHELVIFMRAIEKPYTMSLGQKLAVYHVCKTYLPDFAKNLFKCIESWVLTKGLIETELH